MLLVFGGAEHDHAPLAAAPGEARPHPANDALDDDRGTVLVGHVERAGRPAVADLPHGGRDHVHQHVVGVGTRRQG